VSWRSTRKTKGFGSVPLTVSWTSCLPGKFKLSVFGMVSGSLYRLIISPIALSPIHLRSYPYLDDEHWRNGFDDSLWDHRGVRWSRLQARNEDVGQFWRFGKEAVSRTGAPGRPSCMQYVLDEFQRRIEIGQLEPSGVARQAEVLREWVRNEHPHEKPPTVKTIANNIRRVYQAAKNA
jgi:hypothetical protein